MPRLPHPPQYSTQITDQLPTPTYNALLRELAFLHVDIPRPIWNHLNETYRSFHVLRSDAQSLQHEECPALVALGDRMLDDLKKVEESGVRGWGMWVEAKMSEQEKGEEEIVERHETSEIETAEKEWEDDQVERRERIRNVPAAGLRGEEDDEPGERQIERSESDIAEREWDVDQAERRKKIMDDAKARLRGGGEGDTSTEHDHIAPLTLDDLPMVHTYTSLLSFLASLQKGRRALNQPIIDDAVRPYLTDEADRLAALRAEIEHDYFFSPLEEERLMRGVSLLKTIEEREQTGVQGWLPWVLEKSRMKHVEAQLKIMLEAVQRLTGHEDVSGEERANETTGADKRKDTVARLRGGMAAEDTPGEELSAREEHCAIRGSSAEECAVKDPSGDECAATEPSEEYQRLRKQEEVLSSLDKKDSVEARFGASSTVADSGSSNSSREQKGAGREIQIKEKEDELLANLKNKVHIRPRDGINLASSTTADVDAREGDTCPCDISTSQTFTEQLFQTASTGKRDRIQEYDLGENPFVYVAFPGLPYWFMMSDKIYSSKAQQFGIERTLSMFHFPYGASRKYLMALLRRISVAGLTEPVVKSNKDVQSELIDDIEEETSWKLSALRMLPIEIRPLVLEMWPSVGRGDTYVVYRPTVGSKNGIYSGLSQWISRHTNEEIGTTNQGLRGGLEELQPHASTSEASRTETSLSQPGVESWMFETRTRVEDVYHQVKVKFLSDIHALKKHIADIQVQLPNLEYEFDQAVLHAVTDERLALQLLKSFTGFRDGIPGPNWSVEKEHFHGQSSRDGVDSLRKAEDTAAGITKVAEQIAAFCKALQRQVSQHVCATWTHPHFGDGNVRLRGGGEKFPDYEDSTTSDVKAQDTTPQRFRTASSASSQYPRRIKVAAEEFRAWTGPNPTLSGRRRATSSASNSYSDYQEPDTSEVNANSFLFFPTVSTIVLLTEPKNYIQFSHPSTLRDIREILKYRREEKTEDNVALVKIRKILALRDEAGMEDPDTSGNKQVLISEPDHIEQIGSPASSPKQSRKCRDAGLQDRKPSEKQILDAINILRLDRGASALKLDQLPEDSHTDNEDRFKQIGGLVNALDEECSSSIDWEYHEPRECACWDCSPPNVTPSFDVDNSKRWRKCIYKKKSGRERRRRSRAPSPEHLSTTREPRRTVIPDSTMSNVSAGVSGPANPANCTATDDTCWNCYAQPHSNNRGHYRKGNGPNRGGGVPYNLPHQSASVSELNPERSHSPSSCRSIVPPDWVPEMFPTGGRTRTPTPSDRHPPNFSCGCVEPYHLDLSDFRHPKGQGCEILADHCNPLRTRCTSCNLPFEEGDSPSPKYTAPVDCSSTHGETKPRRKRVTFESSASDDYNGWNHGMRGGAIVDDMSASYPFKVCTNPYAVPGVESPSYPPQPPCSPLSAEFGSSTASLASSYVGDNSQVGQFQEESPARDHYRRQCEEDEEEDEDEYHSYLVERVQGLAHENANLAKVLVTLDKLKKERSHLADVEQQFGDRESDIMEYVEYITPGHGQNSPNVVSHPSSREDRVHEFEAWLRGGAREEDDGEVEPYVLEFLRKGKEKCICESEFEARHLNHLAEFDVEMPEMGPGTFDESGNFVPVCDGEEWEQLGYWEGYEPENEQRGVRMQGF